MNSRDRGMTLDDVEVGQHFVDATAGRWRDTTHSERKVVVIRKTKTRVVVAVVRDDGVVTPRELRLLVRDGYITDKVEGESYASVRLYTEDDSDLATMRAYSARAKLRFEARSAAESFFKDTTPENGQDAIAKIQAYLDSHNPEED